MEVLLAVSGFLLVLLGLVGSLLPVLPGPPLSWIGLLLLYLTPTVPMNWWVLGPTLAVTIAVSVLDYIIPAMGTKKFGGTKAGMWGCAIGLILAIFFPLFGPLGFIIWPFVGALVGELINKTTSKQALKAAVGSFLGFLTGTFLKFFVCIVFIGLFFWTFSQYASELNPF